MSNIEIEAAIISFLLTGVMVAISILIEILVIKYLIRYGIKYFFKMKEYHDGRNAIDEIQQDIIRKHTKEGEP